MAPSDGGSSSSGISYKKAARNILCIPPEKALSFTHVKGLSTKDKRWNRAAAHCNAFSISECRGIESPSRNASRAAHMLQQQTGCALAAWLWERFSSVSEAVMHWGHVCGYVVLKPPGAPTGECPVEAEVRPHRFTLLRSKDSPTGQPLGNVLPKAASTSQMVLPVRLSRATRPIMDGLTTFDVLKNVLQCNERGKKLFLFLLS